jgi:hypothetical protein
MRWTGHVARVEERREAIRTWVGKTHEKEHLEYPFLYVRIILKWILKK